MPFPPPAPRSNASNNSKTGRPTIARTVTYDQADYDWALARYGRPSGPGVASMTSRLFSAWVKQKRKEIADKTKNLEEPMINE